MVLESHVVQYIMLVYELHGSTILKNVKSAKIYFNAMRGVNKYNYQSRVSLGIYGEFVESQTKYFVLSHLPAKLCFM